MIVFRFKVLRVVPTTIKQLDVLRAIEATNQVDTRYEQSEKSGQ